MALNAGDIAIVAFNSDGTDGFAFVALTDIPPNEEIKFTDNGWGADGTLTTNEGTRTWTAPDEGVPLGTVVSITNRSANVGTATGSINLPGGGDQILVYQGDETAPTFLFAVNYTGSGGWQSDADTALNSAVPTGLVDGVTALAFSHADNYAYTGVLIGLLDDIKAEIANTANWSGNNSSAVRAPSSFAVAASLTDPTEGNDVITASDDGDTIDLLAGNDIFIGGLGDDTVTGGLGNDTLTGGQGADTFSLDIYDATATQSDTVTDFNVLDDRIDLGPNGPASFHALQSRLLISENGDAVLHGYFQGADQKLTLENVDIEELTEANFVFDTSAAPRTVTSGSGNSKLFGGLGNDVLTSAGGNDLLVGDDGDDILSSAHGNDRLDGGAGADTMTGGIGNDIYFVDNLGIDRVVAAAGDFDGLVAEVVDEVDIVADQSIEALAVATGFGGLTLTANDFDNKLTGGETGTNVLYGMGGADKLYGIGANDQLHGGDGRDTYIISNTQQLVFEEAGGGYDTVVAHNHFTLGAGQEIETLYVSG
ncbi:MAG: calcium-binding protein, partial [Pseudomonadota bacterium]